MGESFYERLIRKNKEKYDRWNNSKPADKTRNYKKEWYGDFYLIRYDDTQVFVGKKDQRPQVIFTENRETCFVKDGVLYFDTNKKDATKPMKIMGVYDISSGRREDRLVVYDRGEYQKVLRVCEVLDLMRRGEYDS